MKNEMSTFKVGTTGRPELIEDGFSVKMIDGAYGPLLVLTAVQADPKPLKKPRQVKLYLSQQHFKQIAKVLIGRIVSGRGSGLSS